MKAVSYCCAVALFIAAGLLADPADLLRHFASRAQTVTGQEYRVLRMGIDVTGDDKPDLLLAISDRVPWWFVYQHLDNGTYRFLGNLSFAPQAFRVDNKPTRIVMQSWEPREGRRLEILRFDGARFVNCEPSDNTVCSDTGEDFDVWRRRVGLRVLWTRLTDLGRTDPVWYDHLDPSRSPVAAPLHGLTVTE